MTTSSASAARQAWVATVLAVTIILSAGYAAYSDSFRGPFLFDDVESIPGNPTIRQLSPIWPILTSRHTATVIGRPLLSLSLAISYALHGEEVRGYHQFSLAVHLLCGLVLFGLLRRTLLCLNGMEDGVAGAGALREAPVQHALLTTGASFPSNPGHPLSARSATWLAGIAALLWTVHPLNSTAVLYIVQRAELLCGLFYLGSLYCLLRAATGVRPVMWGVVTVACGLFAVLTKEVAATLPLVALLYDRTFLSGSFREALRRRRWIYAGLFASWVLLGVLMFYSEGRRDTATTGSFIRPLDYAQTQFGVIATYLKLCYWPSPLIFDYGVFVTREPSEILPYAVLICVLLIVSVWALWKMPRAGFLAFCVFLILAPTSTIVPLVTHTAAEHRMYLPSAAIVVLTVIALTWVGHRIISTTGLADSFVPDVGKALSVAAAVCVAAGFGWLTYLRANDFRSTVTLWQDTANKRPQNARASYNLGVELQKAGRTAEALPAFNRALAEASRVDDPFHKNMVALTYNVRAGAYAALRDYPAAMQDHDRALALEPRRADFRSHRGQTWGQWRHPAKAAADFTAAIEIDPQFAAAWIGRAAADMQLRDYDRAWQDVAHARALGSDVSPDLLRQLRLLSGRNE